MKQDNVANHRLSEKFLERFEKIATKDNVESITPLSTSIQIKCKCGCTHVEHIFISLDAPHYLRHFVELCEEHSFTDAELKEK